MFSEHRTVSLSIQYTSLLSELFSSVELFLPSSETGNPEMIFVSSS